MKEHKATPKFGAGRRSRYRPGAPDAPVQAITNAAIPHSDDMRHRMIQYSTTMGIRMVCLLLIFVFDGWFKLVPVVGAVVLPWVAVMIANRGADVIYRDTVELMDEVPPYALDAGDPDADDGGPSTEDILAGELVPDTDGINVEGAGPASSPANGTAGAPDNAAAAGAGSSAPNPGPAAAASAGFTTGARFAAGTDGAAYMTGSNGSTPHGEETHGEEAHGEGAASAAVHREEKHHEHL